MSKKQLTQFKKALLILRKFKLNPLYTHLANSAAALLYPETHFNLVRPGIILYGLSPFPYFKKVKLPFRLKPILSWQAKILQIKKVPSGSYISYGLTFKTKKSTLIAVVAVGYYDGYDRHLSNKGEVIIKGIKCPILGRVCMNHIVVDVSKIKNISLKDKATLIGPQLNADELAHKLNTINYEIVTRINPLIPRFYLK